MRIARLGVLSVALILVVASRGICAAALRAGVARAEITPPAGEQMWGYENRRQPAAGRLGERAPPARAGDARSGPQFRTGIAGAAARGGQTLERHLVSAGSRVAHA